MSQRETLLAVALNSHERFDARATDYVRGRPGYPSALTEYLAAVQQWRAERVVADVGAGTGIFTREILARGAQVFAIEPSAPMRRQSEAALGHLPGYHSLAGLAAATSLPDQSVDAIVCAQAFHWFNEPATRIEWRRILRRGGSVALVWNFIDTAQPIGSDYHELLVTSGSGAREVIDRSLATARDNVVFGAGAGERLEFNQVQRLEWTGLLARVHSSSYLPPPGAPGYAAMLTRLEDFFARWSSDGTVDLPHRSVLIHG